MRLAANESLSKAFGIEYQDVDMTLIEGVDYIPYPHVKVPPTNYDDLVKFAQDPENLKRRGRAISKAKTGKKRKPFTAKAKANMAAATKKAWAEGKMAKRKKPRKDPITGKFIGSKK